MTDKYSDFAELAAHEKEGRDFEVSVKEQSKASVAIMAPHAGGIEPKTGSIAAAIAGNEYSLYCFRGLKIRGNGTLHIASHKFDESRCLSMLANHRWVITIHGCNEEGERLFIGGLDIELINNLTTEISRAGIIVEGKGYKHAGTHQNNICNRGKTNMGVQFELSLKFRNSSKVPLFINAVRNVLYKLSTIDNLSI